jgi:hypothetical protein
MAQLKTRKSNAARGAVLFVFSMLVLLGAAPSAGAATAGFYSWTGTLYYVAAPGEANNVTISETTGSYVISDPNANITARFGCTVVDAHKVTCTSKRVRWLYVKTNDLNDTVSFQPAVIPASIDCGAGIDSLNTSDPNTKPANCEYINAPAAAPVVPPTIDPVPPPLSIAQPVATMTKRGSVPLTVSCSAAAATRCTGTLIFVLPAKPKAGQAGASRRGAPNILGREKLSVDRGKKRKVKVSMSSKGKSMVKRSKRLKVTAKLVIKQGGETHISTQSLTIRAPRSR